MPTEHIVLVAAAFLLAFAAALALLVRLFPRLHGDTRRAIARLRDLSIPGRAGRGGAGSQARSVLARVGSALAPGEESIRARLKARLEQAGLYSHQALSTFLGAQLLLAACLPAVALAGYLLGGMTGRTALILGGAAGGLGVIVPSLWLDRRTKQRQATFRKALPDALDMLVLCLEGGVSLTAAMHRVTDELQIAHPELGAEMNIVQREMQLGLTAGEALKKFADRCGLEDIGNLAAVMLQSERFGAGVAKALRLHADGCRLERQQRLEEQAQKASVKILFPTLLCIFPAIFIVILGPAAYQIGGMFSKLK